MSEDGQFGTGEFSLSVTGSGRATHYFQAYAVNGGGTNYTAEAEFLTCPTSPAPHGHADYDDGFGGELVEELERDELPAGCVGHE